MKKKNLRTMGMIGAVGFNGGYRASKDFCESFTAVQTRTFDQYKHEFSVRFIDSYTAAVQRFLFEKLTAGAETVELTLPIGTYTAHNAGDVINVGFEFSKSAYDTVNGDDESDLLRRMAVEEYDPRFIELYRNYVAYDSHEKKQLSKSEWGIELKEDLQVATMIQDVNSLILQDLAADAKDGTMSKVEINNHGIYWLEMKEGTPELLFEADESFKQALKNDGANRY